MTIAAYKNHQIAIDSRYSDGHGAIFTDTGTKWKFVDGIQFFFAGMPAFYDKLLAAYFEKECINANRGFNVEAIVVDNGNLYLCSLDEHGFLVKSPHEWRDPWAIGSGADFAIGAMRAGASAKRAAEVACRCDAFSGGLIRVFRV